MYDLKSMKCLEDCVFFEVPWWKNCWADGMKPHNTFDTTCGAKVFEVAGMVFKKTTGEL
jgi:hypothetical protein